MCINKRADILRYLSRSTDIGKYVFAPNIYTQKNETRFFFLSLSLSLSLEKKENAPIHVGGLKNICIGYKNIPVNLDDAPKVER